MSETKSVSPSISIIVPVYNKESSLPSCMESLLKQTLSFTDMEVVLVDDGSSDGSAELCDLLADKYSFVRAIHQDNGGVSSARNTGMQAANGRYIMFLDADDSISPSTAKALVSCFDRYSDQVDVVTYPLVYKNALTGKTRHHKRETWLEGEGVYHLEDYPYIAQTTMNICVKNNGDNNICFDAGVKMGEDQLFILKNALSKAAIAFTPNAEYIYVKDGTNSSKMGNNPLLAFGDMIKLYDSYLHAGECNPAIREYAYQTILYNIDWRLRSNLLFPIYCEGKERERQEERLGRILRAIPAASYCASPYLREYHKAFLLKKYGFTNGVLNIDYTDEAALVRFSDGTVWKTQLPRILISRVLEKNGNLAISGRLMGPTLLLEDKPVLKLFSGSDQTSLDLGPCSYDYCQAKVKTAKGYGVTFDIAFEQCVGKAFVFELGFSGREHFAIAVVNSLTRHNAYVTSDEKKLVFRQCVMRFDGNALVVSRRRLLDSLAAFADRLAHKRPSIIKRAAVKLFQLRMRGRAIWLYVDLPTSGNEGNALMQFLHDVKQQDGVTRYYVSNFGKELARNHPELEGHVIACESRMHVYCALSAEVVLASYLEKFTFRPVSQKTYNGLGDLVADQVLIYLQHGILHAHMPWYFSYDRIIFDKIVVSTQFEINNLTTTYCYPPDSLIPCGMPRLDLLDASPKRHLKKIAFIPSWRGYLLAGKASKRIELDDSFLNSSYFKETKKFIQLLQDSRILEKFGYTMDLKLHPNFYCYAKLFDLKGKEITLASSPIDEGDYSIVITDFSSYVYDFVYTGSRVLYFVPDYAEFKAGFNQYWELDLPFENGFGPLCSTAEEAITQMKSAFCSLDCHEEDGLTMRNGFFLSHASNHRIMLYRYCRKEV